jgi:glycine cleavage system H protein
MKVPTHLKYTENDEWIEAKDTNGTIGITDYAQDALSDIVFVEILVNEGDEIKKGDSIATLESVKAAADVYSPASGKVIATNQALADTPENVNKDPYGEAWMVKIELSDPAELDELLDAVAYQAKHSED